MVLSDRKLAAFGSYAHTEGGFFVLKDALEQTKNFETVDACDNPLHVHKSEDLQPRCPLAI